MNQQFLQGELIRDYYKGGNPRQVRQLPSLDYHAVLWKNNGEKTKKGENKKKQNEEKTKRKQKKVEQLHSW